MPDNTKRIKAHCNTCLGQRNHTLLHREVQDWEEQAGPKPYMLVNGSNVFEMLRCCGCDSVKLKHSEWFSEDCDGRGEPIIRINYYPAAISRSEPDWLDNIGGAIPSEDDMYISSLLNEIYSALHNNSPRLATMGARALLEHAMVSKIGDKGTFKKNLDAFQTHGFLSQKQREMIEPILEAGHAAIHRGFNPSSEDLNTVMDITEALIETIYIHSEKAIKLKERVPNRGD